MFTDPGLLVAIFLIAGVAFIIFIYKKNKNETKIYFFKSIFGVCAFYLVLLSCFTPILQGVHNLSFTSTEFTFSGGGESKGTYFLSGNTLTLTFTEIDTAHETTEEMTVGSNVNYFLRDDGTFNNSTSKTWKKTTDGQNNTGDRDLNGTIWEQESSEAAGLTATGLQIATGKGKLFDEINGKSNHIIYLLLAIPLILLILVFFIESFIIFGIVSVTGLILNIIVFFGFVGTFFDNWKVYLMPPVYLVFLIYFGLCIFAFYRIKIKK